MQQQHQHQLTMHHHRLPQHRIRTPKRHVPYPDNHPLARHLLNTGLQEAHQEGGGSSRGLLLLSDLFNQDAEDEDASSVIHGDHYRGEDHADIVYGIAAAAATSSSSSRVVGGDGTRSISSIDQHGQQRPRQYDNTNSKSYIDKFLHYFRRSEPKLTAGHARNSRQISASSSAALLSTQQRKIDGGTIVVEGITSHDNEERGGTRYWSITGRNLIFNHEENNYSTTTNNEKNSTTTNNANQESWMDDLNSTVVWNDTNANHLEDANNGNVETMIVNGTIDNVMLLEEEGGVEFGEGIDGNESFVAESELNDSGENSEISSSLSKSESIESQSSKQSNSTSSSSETNKPTSSSSSSSSPSSSSTSSSSSPLYQPIRLQAIFTNDDTSGSKYLTPHQRTILMEEMINPALYAWSKALHVVPVGGGGEGDETRNGINTLIVDQSQLFDNESCGPGLDSGLPSVRVPREHLTTGLTDTDTVIYVSVSFVDDSTSSSSSSSKSNLNFLYGGRSGPLFGGTTMKQIDGNGTGSTASQLEKDSSSSSGSIGNQTTDSPTDSPSFTPSMPPSEVEPSVESRPICPGTYLASATYCSSDQYDRPIAGILSICIDNVHNFFYNKDQIKRNTVTIMHEIGHVLGFNAQSLSHFRDGDTGEPLTPRDDFGDVPDVNVECTGVSPRMTSDIPLPSTNITKFQVVRGGVRVATIVTPTVRRIARNMFGCQSLMGAELESGEGQFFANDAEELFPLSAGECIGDHWERRVFRTDLLNPIVDDVPYSLFISSLTLAYFADSGWYKVNMDRIAPASIWGRNAGCDFVQKKCITSDGHVSAGNNPFFCNNFPSLASSSLLSSSKSKSSTSKSSTSKSSTESEDDVSLEIHGCDLDSSRKAVCSIVEHDSELPNEYTYFNKFDAHGQFYGGEDPTLDYCPVFRGFSNGQCNDKDAQQSVGVHSSLEVFGEDSSRCVIGHVDRIRTALCLPIACVIQDQSLMIKVDGYWKHCMYAGQIISMWWNPKDYVVCPDPSRICPTFFCPNDCFRESGICDYHSGQCLCERRRNTTATNTTTSWFSTYYSSPIMEPCYGLHSLTNGAYQVVERMDSELPEFYVENTTLLLDDPKNFDDKMSRMFAELSIGEVVGLVASFMLFIVFSYLFSAQLVRCYKERLFESSLSKVRSNVRSLSGMLRDAGRSSQNNDNDYGMNSPRSHRRPPGHNPQKDKMVASLLVQMRTEGAALAEQEHQGRLQLGGLTTSVSNEECTVVSSRDQASIDLSSSSTEEIFVHRSDLPPLPSGGRVLAIIGATIVEDEVHVENEDASSSATSTTHVTSQSMSHSEVSEYISPLYEDDEGETSHVVHRSLRLRHSSRTDCQDL